MVNKYRSRRKQLKKHKATKRGGAIAKMQTIPEEHHDVHTSAHHPQDLVGVLQSAPAEAMHVAKKLLQDHHRVKQHVERGLTQFTRFKARIPDKSLDIASMAKAIYKKHKYHHLPKLGGGLSFNKAVSYAETGVEVAKMVKGIVDPDIKEAKRQYDQVNLHPKNFREGARSVAHALSGNFRVGSGYMKGASMAFLPAAGELLPASAGFAIASDAFDELSMHI